MSHQAQAINYAKNADTQHNRIKELEEIEANLIQKLQGTMNRKNQAFKSLQEKSPSMKKIVQPRKAYRYRLGHTQTSSFMGGTDAGSLHKQGVDDQLERKLNNSTLTPINAQGKGPEKFFSARSRSHAGGPASGQVFNSTSKPHNERNKSTTPIRHFNVNSDDDCEPLKTK